jgi:hypothetical protein
MTTALAIVGGALNVACLIRLHRFAASGGLSR